MSKAQKIAEIAMLPIELWYTIWTFPDDYYEGQERDLISTVCYFAFKIIWVLVTLLVVWLTICPFFGF